MSAMGILTELACHVVGDALVQAPSTKVAADRRVGEAVSREVRGFDAGAGMKAFLGAGATKRYSQRRMCTVGQKNGIRAGSSMESSREPVVGVVGSMDVCAPIDVLCGSGSAKYAIRVQKGNTSMKSMRLSIPLG